MTGKEKERKEIWLLTISQAHDDVTLKNISILRVCSLCPKAIISWSLDLEVAHLARWRCTVSWGYARYIAGGWQMFVPLKRREISRRVLSLSLGVLTRKSSSGRRDATRRVNHREKINTSWSASRCWQIARNLRIWKVRIWACVEIAIGCDL